MTELERDLRALARGVSFPEEPDLVRGVRAGLARPRRLRPAWLEGRPVAIALGVVVLGVAAALAVPPARSAILELFRIGGAEIERVDTLPETQPNARLAPGRRVSLAEARDRAGFRVLTPRECGHCDAVLLDESIPGGRVTIVWPGERPLFLMEFLGETIPYVEKLASPGTSLRAVSVEGAPGYWVAGSRHAVVFRDAHGRTLFGRRLADNVLLWERDGVTYRLEGDIPLRRALSIAEQLE